MSTLQRGWIHVSNSYIHVYHTNITGRNVIDVPVPHVFEHDVHWLQADTWQSTGQGTLHGWLLVGMTTFGMTSQWGDGTSAPSARRHNTCLLWVPSPHTIAIAACRVQTAVHENTLVLLKHFCFSFQGPFGTLRGVYYNLLHRIFHFKN